jgi:hypothetical protein
MAEILHLDEVLEKLKGLSPLHRMLMATAGTLQTTLAAYFGEPVDVVVGDQSEEEDGEGAVLLRDVQLVCRNSQTVACRAHTRIEVRNDLVLKLIRERNIGLGQICETLGLRATFVLDEVGLDDANLWRNYRLEGPGFCYRIREDLPRELYGGDAL